MRFNELITGVRADLAIKVFGEDLATLDRLATQIERVVRNVEGASDISIEKLVGLPQMTVSYNRRQISRFGLNINDLNRIISMSFGGLGAGYVYEGEKQFELVMRLDEGFRRDISNIRNLYIPLPSGGQIPLKEVATIEYSSGPAKISRDNTYRRVVIGINIRNRDLESVVDEVSALIDSNVDIPPGYSVDYGGQFENLREARARLVVAVPIALLLIFILLFMAFRSIQETLLIYTAIPLAAVGGVFLLWIRDMPFSISAGVGFIALFGIAVLNGIVLIEHLRHLKSEGISGRELIVKGTKERLRPVLLTASAAAMGFLPMAVSTSAGAEVQRPLATVVIGGLVSATLLTLVVLPVLYSYRKSP
jgi:cobalt-zinc-cadmium resistance protein CzcA